MKLPPVGRQRCRLHGSIDPFHIIDDCLLHVEFKLLARVAFWEIRTFMSVEFEPKIEWDGTSLSRWAVVGGNRIHIQLPREMIHSIPIYNDAIGWEIERYKADIFERLKPKLFADLTLTQTRE
jgi:hypothetical protein